MGMGQSIMYFKGSKVEYSINYEVFLSMKVYFNHGKQWFMGLQYTNSSPSRHKEHTCRQTGAAVNSGFLHRTVLSFLTTVETFSF